MSNLADGAMRVALPLIAVHWTSSPLLIGGVVTALTAPWLVFSLPAGLIVDSVDRRSAMVAANAARALVLIALGLMVTTGEQSIWLLYLAAFALGTAETIYDTAAQSVLPSIVARHDLERANGRLSSAETAANNFIGPLLGGLLVSATIVLGVVGPAGLWMLAFAILLLLPRPRLARTDGARIAATDLIGGVQFVWTHQVLRVAALMVALCNLATSAFLATFVTFAVGPDSPVGASETQYGALLALAGAGGVAGALGTATTARALGRGRTLALSVLGIVAFVGTPGITASFAALLGTFFLGGAAVAAWNVITVSFRQRVTPDDVLGRVNAFYRMLTWGAVPLGALLGGATAELIGLCPLFALTAAVATLCLAGLHWVNDSTLVEGE